MPFHTQNPLSRVGKFLVCDLPTNRVTQKSPPPAGFFGGVEYTQNIYRMHRTWRKYLLNSSSNYIVNVKKELPIPKPPSNFEPMGQPPGGGVGFSGTPISGMITYQKLR